MNWGLAVVAAVGCGRIGFSASADATDDGSSGDAAPLVVQLVQLQEATSNNTPVASLSVTLSRPQQVGDLNVLVVAFSLSQTITQVTDTSGNTYALAAAETDNAFTGPQAIYYAANIRAAVAGANVVTVQFSQVGGSGVYVALVEYGGVSASASASASAMGTGKAVDSGSLAVPFSPALLFAADLLASSSGGGDPSFTVRPTSGGNLIEDRVVMTTGTFHAIDTQASNGGWVMQLVAFRGR